MNMIQEKENLHTSGVYAQRDVTIVKGQGARLWDIDGNEYIDCVGGQGTANIGHSNPAIVEAISEQAKKLIVCPSMFYNDKRAALMEKLTQISNMSRVFLSNSGTESVEAALKFARLITGRTEIVATMRAFHGRTFGSLSATWEKKYREPFMPLVPGFSHVAYNDVTALETAVTDKTAAVILEIVQGEGGVRPGTQEYLHSAQKICRQHGALLIIDEVQTGFGRTGKMFAFQHYNLEPDLLCLAKSIAGGLPMGATLFNARINPMPTQSHGNTFGGYPLICAAALASIDFIEKNHLPEHAQEVGDWFMKALNKIESPLIREIRGKGLMVGIELKQKVSPYLQQLMKQRVLALPAGLTVMRFLPPLVITKADLTEVVEAVSTVLSNPLSDKEE